MSIILGNIQLGDTLVNYKKNSYEYIITYITKYNIKLDKVLKSIFYKIKFYYSKSYLEYANVAEKNAQYICKNLKSYIYLIAIIENIKIREVETGKIIITKWNKNIDDNVKDNINLVYGGIGNTIGVGNSNYHALAYLTFYIEGTKYHVAIETTLFNPYKLQFYVGSSADEFNEIIKARYQCEEFKISYECYKDWMEIRDNKGGKNEKTKNRKNRKKRKNEKTKKRKNEKTKKRKKAF